MAVEISAQISYRSNLEHQPRHHYDSLVDDDWKLHPAMAYNHRMAMSFGQGPMAPPSYANSNHHRNSPSPATGSEGLPTPFENQQTYPQHTQSPSQPLPLATTQSPSSAYPQMRTATPNLSLSSGPQYALPAVTDQSPSPQVHRHYAQMAPPQPYSPGHPHGAQPQYGMQMASHLRPTWPPQGNMQPPMMAGHPGHMGQQPHMMFHPAQQHYHHAYFGQPAPLQERPFKCEQCKAAFSRNHDLKRHKRIHLAVKPFPCDYCEKTFTRKDALKVSSWFLSWVQLLDANPFQRHRLVKGCEAKAARRSREDPDDTNIDDQTPPYQGKDVDSAGTANEHHTPPETP